jgi:hypothetical protein
LVRLVSEPQRKALGGLWDELPARSSSIHRCADNDLKYPEFSPIFYRLKMPFWQGEAPC